ncbi:MAG: T9SS type A sorting domain-containing protein [Flavobacteriaceae bacterium]|nr:T9SS type A sorting domain-containing protein [Flavobacteriaceae bacterium]
MKQIYLSIRISLLIALISLSENALAQCSTTHNQNGWNVVSGSGLLWGQGFIAECDGYLEYVQFISNSTGTVSAGTLNIYNGNTVTGTPLYTQSHPSITITQVNDPIRVDITGGLSLVQNNQYTFEFTVDNVSVLGDIANGYAGGSVFQNGSEIPSSDFIFDISITSTLSIDDFNVSKNVKLFPNPSSKFIQISGLREQVNYKIYSLLGAEIKKGVIINDKQIDIRNLKNGFYLLKFDDGNTIKFIKE